MDQANEILAKETGKWLERLEQKAKRIKKISPNAGWALENIHAYIADCRHFQEKGDFIRAFEAIVYAYGIYETAINSGLIEKGGGLEENNRSALASSAPIK